VAKAGNSDAKMTAGIIFEVVMEKNLARLSFCAPAVLWGGGDGINLAVLREHAEFALGILRETGDVFRLIQQSALRRHLVRGAVKAESPDAAEVTRAI
jgi:hypothetical protein